MTRYNNFDVRSEELQEGDELWIVDDEGMPNEYATLWGTVTDVRLVDPETNFEFCEVVKPSGETRMF